MTVSAEIDVKLGSTASASAVSSGVTASVDATLGPTVTLELVGAVPGHTGPPGADGTKWFNDVGAPVEPVAGANPGDYYLDTATGDVWILTLEG